MKKYSNETPGMTIGMDLGDTNKANLLSWITKLSQQPVDNRVNIIGTLHGLGECRLPGNGRKIGIAELQCNGPSVKSTGTQTLRHLAAKQQ